MDRAHRGPHPRHNELIALRASRAFESFVHLFKGGRVQGQRPCPRSAERGTLLCSHKRRRGSKGEPSPGVPPFLYVCACAPIRWEVVVAPCCHSTPFLWCLPKETVSSRQRKALFLPWWLHHSRERCKSVDGTFLARLGEGLGGLTGRSSQLDAVGCDVGASSPWERRAGPNMSRGGTHKRVSLGLHPVSLRKSKEMGWIRKTSAVYHPIKRRTRTRRKSMHTLSFALRAAGRG